LTVPPSSPQTPTPTPTQPHTHTHTHHSRHVHLYHSLLFFYSTFLSKVYRCIHTYQHTCTHATCLHIPRNTHTHTHTHTKEKEIGRLTEYFHPRTMHTHTKHLSPQGWAARTSEPPPPPQIHSPPPLPPPQFLASLDHHLA
jgi:hypothetical protein